MKSLVVRFSDKASKFETTQQRLKDIAEYLGVSQNKAIAYAINQVWQRLIEDEDMDVELAYKRHGVKVGKITYLNADPAFIERARERLANDVPLPHEDDESLERNLLFQFLTVEQQNVVRSEPDPLKKRHLISAFLAKNNELSDDEWARQVAITQDRA